MNLLYNIMKYTIKNCCNDPKYLPLDTGSDYYDVSEESLTKLFRIE